MAEAKPTASLSSGLLARKGAARPAMRRQGLGGHVASAHDDLGWNDMGHDHDDSDAHAAHVAEIMPMLSPMGAKPVAAEPQSAASGTDLAAGADEAVDAETQGEGEASANITAKDIAVSGRSPLAVKPGKPQVVLQREALEDRVRAPAPMASDDAKVEAVTDDAPPATDALATDASAIDASAPVAASQPEPDEPAVADIAPTLPAPKAVPAAPRKSTKSQATKSQATKSRTRRPPRATGAKAAFTLRIDSERHLRLRLASAVTNLSAQQILIDAFDRYLKTIPEIETLAGNIARRDADRS